MNDYLNAVFGNSYTNSSSLSDGVIKEKCCVETDS